MSVLSHIHRLISRQVYFILTCFTHLRTVSIARLAQKWTFNTTLYTFAPTPRLSMAYLSRGVFQPKPFVNCDIPGFYYRLTMMIIVLLINIYFVNSSLCLLPLTRPTNPNSLQRTFMSPTKIVNNTIASNAFYFLDLKLS